jgi:hypothetical protein
MYASLARFAIARPWTIIAAVIAALLVVMAGARNLVFVSDYDSTLPNRSALTAEYRALQSQFGDRNTIAMLVTSQAPTARLAAACRLSTFLETQPGVAPGRVFGVGSNTLKYVNEAGGDLVVTGLREPCVQEGGVDAQVLQGLGPQRPLVAAPDGGLLIYADIALTSGDMDPFLKALRTEIAAVAAAHPGVAVALSGQPVFIAQIDAYSKRIAIFFPIIMALILLMHWEALRSLQAVVIPIVTGFLAVAFALGVYGWLKLPIDTYSALAPILILAIGAGHSVQLLKRYMEEVRRRQPAGQVSQADNEAALMSTLTAMGPVLTIAVAGASACLFALLFLGVDALARFGLLSGCGILFALALELTLIPAIRILLPRPTVTPRFGELSALWREPLRRVGEAAMTAPRGAIAAGLALVVAILAVGIARIDSRQSPTLYIGEREQVRADLALFTDADVGVYAFDVGIDAGAPGGVFDPRLLNAALALEKRLAADPDVRATTSAASVIAYLKCRFASAADCAGVRIESAEEASQIWTVLYGAGQSSGLIDEEARHLRVRAFVKRDDSTVGARLIDATRAFAQEEGLSITVGGALVSPKALGDGMVIVSLEKTLLLIAIVGVIGALAFRSLLVGVLFAIPSMFTIAANFSYLGWSGTPLNVGTASVATIAVGVGVDYLVYLTFRMRELVKEGLSYEDAMRAAHASAGGAAVCVASAVAVGYAVLIFSPGYLLHHWIAILMGLTMLMSLAGALFVFPALVRLMRPRLWAPAPGAPVQDGARAAA